MLMLVSTPLGIVNHHCSGFPVSGGIYGKSPDLSSFLKMICAV